MMKPSSNQIPYTVLQDATCYFCGGSAVLLELPNGVVATTRRCINCDDYNQELQWDEVWGDGQMFDPDPVADS